MPAKSNRWTDHPTLMDTKLKELGMKYKIHDITADGFDERMRGFMNELRKVVKSIYLFN